MFKRENEIRSSFAVLEKSIGNANVLQAQLPLVSLVTEYAIELPDDSAMPFEYLPETQTDFNPRSRAILGI